VQEAEAVAAAAQTQSVTGLLRQWGSGDAGALDELLPLVYRQLHELAARCMRGERPDHTLRATALVNEAFLRLADADLEVSDRVHFYAVAAKAMRRILVDHARSLNSDKRGRRLEKMPFDEALFVGPAMDSRVVALDDSLNLLAAHDARKSEVVEMIYFGGLTYSEAALALNISEATVHRELKMAKAWLYCQLLPDAKAAE
jgi:RNA polymerase sigma factor (TIGR02999 family)